MNNKIIIITFIIILCIIFIYAFSASYSSENITNIAYVIAIGIDTSNIENNYKFTFEFIDVSSFSEDSSSESTSPILEEVIAPSISSAVDIMNSYAGKQLNLSHCKVLVLSKEVSQNGVLSLISEIINDKQSRPTINVVIADNNSKKYLEKSTSKLEKTITKYFDIFTKSTSYTGYTSDITIAEFYEDILTEESGAIAIHGNILSDVADNTNQTKEEDISNNSKSTDQNIALENSINGDKGTENSGIVVFKEDVYIDTLSSKEALCYAILSNKIDNFFLSIENPFGDEGLLDLSLSTNHSTSINMDTSNENPNINIEISLENKILSVFDNVDYNNEENLNLIASKTSEYLEKNISDYLYKCSKQYNTDLNHFYKTAKRNFLTNSDWYSYDWKNKFQNSVFNISVNNEIIPTFIVSQSERY